MIDQPPSSESKTDQTTRAESESRFYDRVAEGLTVEGLEPLDVFAPTCLENVYLLEPFLGKYAWQVAITAQKPERRT